MKDKVTGNKGGGEMMSDTEAERAGERETEAERTRARERESKREREREREKEIEREADPHQRWAFPASYYRVKSLPWF